MNADRLHALLIKIHGDFEETELPQRLRALSEALDEQINSPDPEAQEAVGVALLDLYGAIDRSEIQNYSPAWMEMLEELGFRKYLGSSLRRLIDEAFRGAEITPTLTRDAVNQYAESLERLQDAVIKGIDSLSALSVGHEELAPGVCEIGFLIPKHAIESRLDLFAEECEEFDRMFGCLSEIATGDRHQYKIKTISSSDLSVFLETIPPVAAVLAVTAERILAAYKQLLEIRKLRSELVAASVPEKALKEIDNHASQSIEKEIVEIVKELMKSSSQKADPGRKNELENAVTIALRKLANRIDRGFHIEVRVGPDPVGDEVKLSPIDLKNVALIRKAAPSLQFISPEGSPMLSLPEESGNGASSTTKPRKKVARKRPKKGVDDPS